MRFCLTLDWSWFHNMFAREKLSIRICSFFLSYLMRCSVVFKLYRSIWRKLHQHQIYLCNSGIWLRYMTIKIIGRVLNRFLLLKTCIWKNLFFIVYRSHVLVLVESEADVWYVFFKSPTTIQISEFPTDVHGHWRRKFNSTLI